MNQKRPYKTDWHPAFLYEVDVESGSKTYTITRGTLLSVYRKPGLIAGKYSFEYAEMLENGVLLLYVLGPVSRYNRKYRIIRQKDVKAVHLKTRPNG